MSERVMAWQCDCCPVLHVTPYCGYCAKPRPEVKPEVSEDMKSIGELRAAYWVARGRADSSPLDKLNKEAEYAWMMVLAKARELLGQEAAKLREELAAERDRLSDCRRVRSGLEVERRKLCEERDAARVERNEARGLLDAKIAECEEMKRKLETEKQRRAGYEKEVGERAKFLLWDYSLISWSMILSPCQRAIQVIRELHEDRRQGDVSGLPAVGDTVEIGRPMPLPSFGDSQAWTYVGYTSVVEAPSMMLATGKVFLADEGKQWRRRVQPSPAPPTPDGADDTAAVCPGCRRLGVCAIHDGRGHKGTMGEAGSALPTPATPPAEATAGELPKMARLGLALVTSTGIDPEFREACMKLARLDAIDYAEAVTRELKQAARPSPSTCPRCGMTFITGFTCMCGRTR